MSAAYGLAQGKVVLSGLEDPASSYGHYVDCPVVNLRPDVEQIVSVLEDLILDRPRVRRIGEASRVFAERHHDHLRVGQQFIDIYSAARRTPPYKADTEEFT